MFALHVGISPGRVMSSIAHLRSFRAWLHGSEEASILQLWQVVGDTASDLTSPGIKPMTFHEQSEVFILLASIYQ